MSRSSLLPSVRGRRGIVAPDKNGFRAAGRVDCIFAAGPRRTREVDVIRDLALVRACPAKERSIFLAALCGRVAGSNAHLVAALMAPGDSRASSAAASRRAFDVGYMGVSRRKRAVGGTSRQSGTDSTDHSLSPRHLESALRSRAARKRRRGKSAGPTPAAGKSSGLQVAAATTISGDAVPLVLRGLNIQYPFSRLILAGLKDTEVRDYALGYRNIAHQDEEMFLIETPPKNLASVGVDHTHLGPPPRRAQVVGTVCFSKSEKYKTRTAWNGDRERHCIRRGSPLDWQGDKGEKHAWRIGQVRRFHGALPVSDHTQTGYPTPRSLTVRFAGGEDSEVRSRVGASQVVGSGGHGMHIQQQGAGMYISISMYIYMYISTYIRICICMFTSDKPPFPNVLLLHVLLVGCSATSGPLDTPWWRRLCGLGAAQPDLELCERVCEQGGHVLARTPRHEISGSSSIATSLFRKNIR